MPVNLNQYWAAIAVFNNRNLITNKKIFYFTESNNVGMNLFPAINVMVFFFFFFMFVVSVHQKNRKIRFKLILLPLLIIGFCLYHIWLHIHLVNLSGDVEKNPGPKSYSAQYLTICHWNLNSIAAHNFIKIALLKTDLSVHKMDIVCLSETFLDSSISIDDDNLQIPGYSSVRADHPSNTKRGGVLLYNKSFLPIKLIDVNYLNECISFELRIGGKVYKFLTLYRSPSQNRDEFETFLDNLELNFDHMADKNPYLMVALGDFNAKSNSWYRNDSTDTEGLKIDILTSTFGFHQIINEATHIFTNSSSCIDLIFTSQPNLVTESGVHSSLHENCHHQITYVKFNLNVIYPPPYEREVWHYKLANSECIQRAIANYDWEKAFYNIDVNKKVLLFNETVLNIIRNFIPHEAVTFDDRDPPWITSRIKK